MPTTLADVRALALTLPRTTEGAVRGRVKFYVGRIVYLAFARDETMMGFGFPKEWRDAALESGAGEVRAAEDGRPQVQLAGGPAGGDRRRTRWQSW